MIDGSGRPGREADVVARGFIDIHTHSDFFLPLNPRAESKIREGDDEIRLGD
jgi:N-acyl-D-amino-acid deacylase